MQLTIFQLNYKDDGLRIGIRGYLDTGMQVLLRACGHLKFSKTYKCWYLPYCKDVWVNIKNTFPDIIVEQSDSERTVQPTKEEHHTAPIASVSP